MTWTVSKPPLQQRGVGRETCKGDTTILAAASRLRPSFTHTDKVLWRSWLRLSAIALMVVLCAGRAMGATPVHRPNGAWMTDWLVFDRYLTQDEQSRFLAGAQSKSWRAPRELESWEGAGTNPCRWKRVSVRGDLFDIHAAIGRDFPGKTAFLYCDVVTDQPAAIELRLSCRPDASLWLNGMALERGDYCYGEQFKGKGTWSFETTTVAGTNTLLMAVSQLGLDAGFAMRILPPERAVLRGQVLNAAGQAIRQQVRVAAWLGEKEVASVRTENGIYRLSLVPDSKARYDISFTYGEEGCWWLGELLTPGQRAPRNAQLHPASSLSGTLTMLDAARSPHRQVLVQALRGEAVAASALSDEKGQYQFINLRPGDYRLRCLTPARERYYRPMISSESRTSADEDATGEPSRSPVLHLEEEKPIRGLDFRFPAFKRGFWKRYDAFDGLPSNKTRGLVASASGELWLQTDAGLGRFDGTGWTTVSGTEGKQITALVVARDASIWYGTYTGLFRKREGSTEQFTTTNGLPDASITCLAASKDGGIWIGTEYGLSRYDGHRFNTVSVNEGLVQNHINTICEAVDGVVWIGTGSGLSRYDGKAFKSFTTAEGLPGNEITAIDCTRPDAVVVATAGGIARFKNDRFEAMITAPAYPVPVVRTIETDKDGRLWLGTEKGASIVQGNSMIFLTPDDGLGGRNVASIVSSGDGFMWFATENGLARLDTGFSSYTTRDGLADNRVFDLRNTPSGLWFGTEWGGVGQLDHGEFTTVLPGLYARKLYVAKDGLLWVGCDKGALAVDGTRTIGQPILPNRWIMAMDQDANGEFWFGDGWSGGGLVHMGQNVASGRRFETFTRSEGLADDQVNVVLCRSTNLVWAGTSRGLSLYNGTNFINFTERDGLPNSTVRALHPGTNGASLWIGTDAGIAFYDGDRIRNITSARGLPSSRVWCIHRSNDGLLWFGTDTHGLFAYDGVAFSTFDTRDGLADNSVTAIDEDAEGTLWLATSRGGISSCRRKTTPPRARFTQVEVQGRFLDPAAQPLKIRIGDAVTFNYESADWATMPAKKQYQIRLRTNPETGSSAHDLEMITNRTDFDWTPRAGGHHVLELRAIGQHLVYSAPARLEFDVFIPWHERTSWRIAGTTTLLAVLLTGLILVRMNLQQRREARRLKDLMFEQERSARAVLEEKNRQLELGAAELLQHQRQLEAALANVKTLRGLVPICAACKKIRDDKGFWQQLESYVQSHSEAHFSHGMCPECIKKWYPDLKDPETEDEGSPGTSV